MALLTTANSSSQANYSYSRTVEINDNYEPKIIQNLSKELINENREAFIDSLISQTRTDIEKETIVKVVNYVLKLKGFPIAKHNL